ncbi:MAG TPA: hypothetical protein VJU83_08335 [Burkholderiales bacterium]|nr:hypothetical protein [Burkholderiales bacterium]
MKTPAPFKRLLLIVLTVAGGAIVGYLAWDLSIRFGDITVGGVKAIAAWVLDVFGDSEWSRQLTLILIIAVRNIAGIVVMGALTGAALRWIRYRRAFIYAILLWPLVTYAILMVARMQNPAYANPLYEYARGAAVIYSLFMLTVFCVYRVALRFKPSAPKVQTQPVGL